MFEEISLPPQLVLGKGFTGYAVDSRNVCKGALFFALPGERNDGHSFLSDAKERGAAAAVVEESYRGENFGLQLFTVKSPLAALQQMARMKVAAASGRVVAVTGSVGKTMVKGFLETLLKQRYRLMATPGNMNSQVGLPLAILQHLRGDEEVILLEMAMSEQGQISKLVDIAPPDIALVNSVELAHAGNFSSIEEIALAKGEIFKHPHTGVGVVSAECNGLQALLKCGSCYKRVFSLDSEEGRRLIADKSHPFTQRHILHNLLAALTVADCLGLSYEESLPLLSELTLPKKRLTMLEKRGVTFIDDSYNACEASAKAALDSMPSPSRPDSRRIAVFGEMRELGKFSNDCHGEVAKYAIDKVDVLFCLGEMCRPMVRCWEEARRPVVFYDDREKLARDLASYLKPGDVVLLKGSNALAMGDIVEQV